jgi:hypothetical protein
MNGAFTLTDVPRQSVTAVSALAAAATKVAAAPMKISFFIKINYLFYVLILK